MILQARNRALVLAPQLSLEACVRDGRSDLEKQRPCSPGLETEALLCKWPRQAEALSCSTDTRGLVLALQVLLHSCLHDERSGLSNNLRSCAPGLETETLVCRPRNRGLVLMSRACMVAICMMELVAWRNIKRPCSAGLATEALFLKF